MITVGQVNQQNTIDLTLLGMIDCCTRDIHAAPSGISKWVKKDPHYLLWVQDNKVIGYRYNKKHLMRVVSCYDQSKKSTGGDVAHSIVASDIVQCTFEIHKEQKKIVGVSIECTIQKGGKDGNARSDYAYYIAVQNT